MGGEIISGLYNRFTDNRLFFGSRNDNRLFLHRLNDNRLCESGVSITVVPSIPAVSHDEWHALFKAVQSPREAALLWLIGGAERRISEVAALKVGHLDRTGGYLHVVDGKGGKQLYVHLAKARPRGSRRPS